MKNMSMAVKKNGCLSIWKATVMVNYELWIIFLFDFQNLRDRTDFELLFVNSFRFEYKYELK